MAHGRLMPVNLQAPCGFWPGCAHNMRRCIFINANLPLPLERRERLRHKGQRAAVTPILGAPGPPASRTLRHNPTIAAKFVCFGGQGPIMKSPRAFTFSPAYPCKHP